MATHGASRASETWTPEREQQLRDLWCAKPQISAGEISRIMELSKSAILGKAHRLKLPERESPIVRSYPVAQRPARSEAPHQVAKPTAKSPARRAPARPAALPATRTHSPFRRCQWIERDGTGFTDADKCGQPTVPGQSWCAGHNRRAWAPRATTNWTKREERRDRR